MLLKQILHTARTAVVIWLLGLATSLVAQETQNAMVDGKRHGQWRVEGKNGQIREGVYEYGKETGVWKTYDKDGSLKSLITYVRGQAVGEATFYFPDGRIMEQGYWNIDHWEGGYERYHENGNKACKFNYDNRGRREGEQIYYHENGKNLYEGRWNAGKIKGALSIYDEKGRKSMERTYDESGNFQGVAETAADKTLDTFRGTGNYTLFNPDNGKVDKKGYFENGLLINGTRYIYDAAGKLVKTETYSNGVLKN